MSEQILTEFVQQETKRRWSDDELRALSAKHCRQVAQWNGKAVAIDEELRRKIDNGKQPTIMDKKMALQICAEPVEKKRSHVEIDEKVVTGGGRLMYTPDSIVITELDNTQIEFANSPIPLRPDQKSNRASLPHVSLFVSQVIRQSGGVWYQQTEGLASVFGKDGINIQAAVVVASLACRIMENDSIWKIKDVTERNSVTGIRAITFVRDALSRAAAKTYDYLSTIIVVDVLRAVVKDGGGKWVVREDMQGIPAVSKKCYKARATPPSYRSQFKQYPAVFEYLGGFIPKVNVPAQDGTIGSAIASLQKLRTVVGGDDSTIFLMSSMRGMSGFSSEMGKRIQFLLSATLSAWKDGLKVDIRLSSIGDTNVLISSLNYWKGQLQAEWNLEGSDWFRFLAPTREPIYLPEAIKIYFIPAHRTDACAIWYSPNNVPTSVERRVAVDYDGASSSLLPPDVLKHFIAYSVIYGYAPFVADTDVAMQMKKRTFEMGRQYTTYQFGTSSRFRGVISSKSMGLNLIGWGWEKIQGAYDLTLPPQIQYIPLSRIQHQKVWYDKVSSDCAAAYVAMFGAVQRYSSISSLVYMSKKAIQLSLVLPTLDSDVYVAEVIEKERQSTGTKFDISALELMEDEDESFGEFNVLDELEVEEDDEPLERVPSKKQKPRDHPIIKKPIVLSDQDEDDDIEEVMPRLSEKKKKREKVKEEDGPSKVNVVPLAATAFKIPEEKEEELAPDKGVEKDTLIPSVADL